MHFKWKGRLKKPWVETVRNDFKALNLTIKMRLIGPIGNVKFL